jgi:NAD(P)-dependent dehydrogenase (short-subunit alcohol dehydrogenase family)
MVLDQPLLMLGKYCVVTGGTDGIGLVTARRLAAMGACTIIIGRDMARGVAAQESIHQATGVDRAVYLQADLSDTDQVRLAADTISRRFERVDVLVNNAGAMFGQRQLSAQGLEMTFALNHLSMFLLTGLLLPKLKAAPKGARIVNVSSEAHRRTTLDFDDLQGEHVYNGWQAYRRSKLANLLFTQALAQRLDSAQITVNALHPGFVATRIGTRHGLVSALFWRLATLFAIGLEKGADTSIYLAAAPEAAVFHGEYLKKCKPAKPSAAALDEDAARRLWEESLRLLGGNLAF